MLFAKLFHVYIKNVTMRLTWRYIMKRYTTVLFDLDGTLLYTLDDICEALNNILDSYHMPRRTPEEVEGFVGDGIPKLIERAAQNNTDQDTLEHMLCDFDNYYAQHANEKTHPYPGIIAMLAHLKEANIRCAVVSNKTHYGVEQLCKAHFDDLLAFAQGTTCELAKKPQTDMVDFVLDKLEISDKHQCIYIGDSEVDIITASNAHIDQASVTWGYRTQEALEGAGAQRLFGSVEALEHFLLKEYEQLH